MDELLKSITATFGNQFVSGGLLLMLSGSALALARNLPAQFLAWFRRRATIEVEILNSDPLFELITIWLDQQPYSKRSRVLAASTDADPFRVNAPIDRDDKPAIPKIILSPGPGRHVFFYNGKLIYLFRNRESASAVGMKGMGKKVEKYEITVLGRNQKSIRSLLEDVIKLAAKPRDGIKLYHSCFGYWECGLEIKPRSMASVVLPVGIADSILADAKNFLESEAWYRQTGIPWHRGYLLYGIPGSGKTSLVSALAGELKMPLYLMNISTSGMDDEKLSSLMSSVSPGSIVLMEDVDCSFPDRDDKENKRVTLGGLLNCLDGVQSKEGCMIFMTTNFKNKLDSALLRPGRVDVQVEFKLADEHQILQLKDRLAPDLNGGEVLLACKGMTMAEAQQWMLAAGRNKSMAMEIG